MISASPTPSLLLTVSAPVVRLVTASTHPSHQPISHQLCGVLAPTMEEKEKEEEVAVGEKKQEAEKEKEEEEVAVGAKKQEAIREHQLKMLREALLCVLRDLLPHSHIDGLSVVEDGTISLSLGSDSCPVIRYQLLPCLAGYGVECGRSFPSLAGCSRVWGKSSLSFTVFMDALAMACYGIPDVRCGCYGAETRILYRSSAAEMLRPIFTTNQSVFFPLSTHMTSASGRSVGQTQWARQRAGWIWNCPRQPGLSLGPGWLESPAWRRTSLRVREEGREGRGGGLGEGG